MSITEPPVMNIPIMGYVFSGINKGGKTNE